MMQTKIRAKLKTGKRPQQLNTKTLKEGEVLFQEGSCGRELFIIQEGKVGVYKNSPDGAIELATIEKNGIIGEMSLLDNQPRSATIKALEKSKVIIINENVFQAALKKAPVWLTSIVKIVVSRLRDTNKRVDQTVLRDRERGLVSLILLLLPQYKNYLSSKTSLSYDLVIVEAFYVCRLKRKETEKILLHLTKRGIVEITQDAERKKQICFVDIDVFDLFYEYLTLKSQQKKFRETTIPPEAVGILGNIAYVAQKSGTETEDGIVLSMNTFLKDMTDNVTDNLDRIILDLRRKNLINILPEENDSLIIFKKETLSRIKKIQLWLPRFEMELK